MSNKEKYDVGYLRTYRDFFDHRMRYYTAGGAISEPDIYNRVLNVDNEARIGRIKTTERLGNTEAEVIITTATKNRRDKVTLAYESLIKQHNCPGWHWLIVDNGSCDGTVDKILEWKDERVSVVKYTEQTGCAFPVRNFAFDLVHLGLRKNVKHNVHWVINIDSDDRFYDEYSLFEVAKLTKRESVLRSGVSLVHGFAAWETFDENGKEIMGTLPAKVDNDFPEVRQMQDVHERGLVALSALVPGESLSWLRYPREFSFEDDGLSQKIMLQGIKKGFPWIYTDNPIILKGYGEDTLIFQNDRLGDQDKVATIGIGHKVRGIRAVIVSYLQTLRDYYVRNNL